MNKSRDLNNKPGVTQASATVDLQANCEQQLSVSVVPEHSGFFFFLFDKQ